MTAMLAARKQRAGTMLPIFRIRLRNGASIGPVLLRRLWSLALGSQDVSVARDQGRPGQIAAYQTYIVSAIGIPGDVTRVETALRQLLQERLAVAHIELTRML